MLNCSNEYEQTGNSVEQRRTTDISTKTYVSSTTKFKELHMDRFTLLKNDHDGLPRYLVEVVARTGHL